MLARVRRWIQSGEFWWWQWTIVFSWISLRLRNLLRQWIWSSPTFQTLGICITNYETSQTPTRILRLRPVGWCEFENYFFDTLIGGLGAGGGGWGALRFFITNRSQFPCKPTRCERWARVPSSKLPWFVFLGSMDGHRFSIRGCTMLTTPHPTGNFEKLLGIILIMVFFLIQITV